MKYLPVFILASLFISLPAMKKKVHVPECLLRKTIWCGKKKVSLSRVQEITRNGKKLSSDYSKIMVIFLSLCDFLKKDVIIKDCNLCKILHAYGFCNEKGHVPEDVLAVVKMYGKAYFHNAQIDIQSTFKRGRTKRRLVVKKLMMDKLIEFFGLINEAKDTKLFVRFCRCLCEGLALEDKLLKFGRDSGICDDSGIIYKEAQIYAQSWIFPNGKW